MAKVKRLSLLMSALVLLFMLASLACMTSEKSAVDASRGDIVTEITAGEGEKLSLVNPDGESTKYVILYSAADDLQADSVLAGDLSGLLAAKGVYFRFLPDTAQSTETEFEILLGTTNRQESKDFYNEILASAKTDDDLAWGYATVGSKVLFTANSTDSFAIGRAEFLEFLVECDYSPDSGVKRIITMTRQEYEEKLEAEEEERRAQYIKELQAMLGKFEDSQFNTDKFAGQGEFYKPLINDEGLYLTGSRTYGNAKYESPWYYPAENQHPRYLITSAQLDEIKKILAMGEDPNSDYATLAKTFWKLANTDMESIHYGVFQNQYKNTGANSWLEPTGEPYRYDGETLGIIDAKAMAYLITGDVRYAYEAIIAIKNAMLSLHYTTDLHQDVYHGPSHVMVTLAAVYDWCYPVLSETDKWHLIWGTAQILGPQMESGYRYPPTGHNGVNGHGTGPQFLRDWMTMATVFYDEAPDWWEFIAGRYFQEYLPVSNAQFVNGWVSQGTATYAPIKIHVAAWAAYLIYVACGEQVLTPDARQTMYFFMSHTTPKDYDAKNPDNQAWREYYFQTGDGPRSETGTLVGFAESFVIAALYNDPVIYAYAKHITNNHSRFDTGTIYTMTPAFQLCFTSMVDYNGEGYRDGVDTIQYFADPAGQMTVREAWDDPDSVAVMMRLMNLTMANHEGKDHGTFQIYYKGLLAATSGSYKKYGAATHLYYLQATIGHNGLLVFNPAHASENPNNTASYYYSGSQEYKNFSSNYASWIENSRMVTTIGADYGYNADGTPKYGYLAGDMTEAYPAKTAEYIARHMLTVFTGDEDFPAIVVTFDQINAFGENFSKSWLLHTIKEPEIDIDNLTATVVNGEGKLLVQSLFGADAIMKVGGEGKAYWINGYFKDYNDRGSWDVKTQNFTDENDKGSWVEGKNVLDEFTPDDNAKNIWGRIELRSVGSKATDFLTVMAVTDASNEKSFVTTPFESETVYGFSALKKTVAFAKSYDLEYKEFTFDTDGVGLHEYYVVGLASGTWRVYVDGVAVATTFSKEEGAIINFTAPTGKVTIKPGNDVVGANGGKIQYVTGGATMPENTPYSYNNENVTPLPLEGIVRGEDTFLGWYLTETFEDGTEITEIPMGTTGTVKVYARWISTFLTEDYSSTKINIKESSQTINGITYFGSTKIGSSFTTKEDVATGRKYLEWVEGEKDPIINQTSTDKNFSTLGSPDKCVTFDIAISANPGSTPMKTEFRILAKQTVGGVSINAVGTDIFRTKTDGKVYAMDNGTEKYLTTLSADSVTHLRIVMDFKNGQIRYYDENNYYFDTTTFTAPSSTEAANTEEYLRCLTQYLWYWYGGSEAGYSDATLRIYEIAVREGDRVNMNAPTDAIIYSTAGGKIVGNAPNGYNTKTGTALPTEVSRDCFEFDGWYLTPDFSGEPVTEIGKEQSGPIIVYAKWKALPNTINYNLDGGTLIGRYEKLYDAENGTDITNIVPVRTGRVFVGWYTSPTFEEETRVGVIGKGATEPVDVYAKWTYPDGSIIYELNGASKPAGLPESFISGTVTPIPGDITKDYATFLGWYTTPDFKEGTEVTEIPADQTGFVTLYAKWAVKVSENWSSTDVDISNGSSVGKNGISYSGKGDSVYTTVDENGNRYLLWKPGTSDPTLIINNAKIAPRYMAESAISYTLTIGKNGDAVIPNFEYRLIGKKNVSGGAAQSDIYFGKLIDGTFYLGNNAEQPLYNLYEEERVTVRIVIDFEDTTDDGTVNGTITAYDENGAAIGSLTFAPTSASGATTMAEYKQCFDNYLFYSRKTGSGGTLDDAIRYYELTVEEGNKHKKTSNAINYVTSGGMLPDGAPSEYDPVNGTDVSGVIPTRHGYIFLGWYTTVGCLDGTRVENIGKGEAYSIVLYAKWDIDPTSVYYEPNGGTLIGESVDNYNPETGTDISSVTAEKHGYDFAGWYLDKDLTVPADGYIGKDGTEPITLYAKWTVRKDTIYYETNGGVIEGDFDEFYDAENGTALPENVSRENYIFAGWYLDAEFTVPAGEKIGVGADAPIAVYAKWTVPDGKLVFVANGGTLPENMPDSYDSATGLLLPTNVTRDGYVFGGWYTDPEFKSERTDYVPYGSTEGYVFYAKWIRTLHNKTWDDETISHPAGKNTGYNGIGMNSMNSTSGSFKTEDDANGGKYIEATLEQGQIVLTASVVSGHQIRDFETPEMALSFDYARVGANALLNNTLRLETSGSRYGNYNFIKIDGATGEARFYNESGKLSDKVIATVGSEAVTFRIVIDFYNETLTAYGDSYEILDRVNLGAVPKISANYPAENLVQPTTWAEWQSVAYGYYFYNTFTLPTGAKSGAAAYDNLKVYDGNPYFNFTEKLPEKNGITFVTNGGALENAPTHHDPVNGTDLSTVIPEKHGFVLEGWYTTETFDEGTRVENIAAGDIDPMTLYAKWVIDPTTIYFAPNGGEMPDTYPEFYDKQSGTSLESVIPTKHGYVFDGWYDNNDLVGDALTSIGVGRDAPVTLYAKWSIRPDTLYSELNGGTLDAELPEFYDAVNGTSLEKYQPTKQGYAFAGWYDNPEFSGEALTSVGAGKTAPVTLYAKWNIGNNVIYYELNGGNLPEGASNGYDTEKGVMLPTAIRDGYVFGGWYETADFTGDRVDFIRYGETRGYMLYAKWVKVLMSEEDWLNSSGAPIEITHASKPNNLAVNGVHYNASSGTDAKPVIYSSTEDGNGGRYMKITATGVSSFLNATGSGASGSYHLKYFEHPEMSFEFTYGMSVKEISEDGTATYYPLASTTVRLQTPSSEGYGSCTFLSISKNGTAALAGSSKVIATLTEENPTATFRLNLDFVTGTVTAYDENYAVIDSAALTFPTNMTAASKPTTWLEWQKVASNYYFYGQLSAPSGTTTYGAIFDGIKVYDGNAFVNFVKVLPKSNELTLDAGEGTLPEGAPTEYDKKNGTDITAVVPVREGYAFDGWYRTSDFSGERVYSIGIDETEPVTLYAKWALPMYTIVYNHNTGAEPATSREAYDTELGLVLPTPTREGYVFGGWYTTESFNGGTRVEKIEIGDTAAYELYARWFAVILETNLDTSSLDLTAQSKTQDGVTFNAAKERCTIKSIDDGSGKYVQMGVSDYTTTDGEYTSESKSIDAIVAVTSNTHNLTQMAETTLSLQFDFVYTEGTRLANASISIATSGNKYGSIGLGKLYGDTGEIRLTGSSKVIGDLMDDEGNAINGGRVTVRLAVDFASETATAYDENGEILDSITVNAPSTGGCTDLLDWQKKATNYLFYSWIDNPKKANKDGINAYVGYDNFLIVDGNIYS